MRINDFVNSNNNVEFYDGLRINKNQHNNTSSSSTLNSYKKKKKELENQLLNYKREEANPWWDKNDNVVENVGNVFHKLFFEKPEDRYKKDEQYDALEKEYADINKKIDDYLVENKTYDTGVKGYLQKSADVTAGNVRTSVDGINSTILKATGQKPVVYDSYAERIGNKAISQSKGAEKVGLEITGSVARMVPQMIMPTRKASYVMGFANYGGSAYNQAKKEGYDDDKATLYGVTIGGLEMGLQGLLGGLDDIYGSSIAGRATDKIMRKIITNPTLRSYITKVGGEFSEEYLQEFLNPIVRNVILEEENGADFWNQAGMENKIKQFAKNFFNEQNLYAGALGGLTSGIMDSPALFVNKTNSNSVSTKPTVPTVQEVVAQENTKKEQGTGFSTVASSFNEEANLPSSQSELLMDKSTSNTNNITQSNDSVNQQNTKFNNEIDDALNDNQSKGNIYLGKPTNSKVINLIKKVTGIDVSNRNQVLSKDYVRHLFKHSKETNPNQIPVTIEDVKKIPDILSNPDTVVRGSDTLDASRKFMIPSVRYIKTDNTGKMFVVEAIPNKGNLQIKTMWKEPTKLIHGNNTRHHTSETANSKDSTTLIDNNIPQSNENVKSGISINNNMQNTQNNQSWQKHLEENYPANGTRTNMRDILLPTGDDIQRLENSDISLPLPKDPTKESSYEEPEKLAQILSERPVTFEDKDSWLKKLVTINVLDKGYYVDKLARNTQNRNLSSKYDYMLMANGIAQQVIGNERFNPKTQKSLGKGLHKIFEPIENSGKLQEFSEYMYHKHNISRMSLNTLFQEDNKPIFGDSITSESSKNIVEKYETENPEFLGWAKEIYDYNNFLLDVLVDYEVISSEDKQYYNNKYPYYVPTIRATDKVKNQMEMIGKKATVNNPIKKAKGGNQDIIPLKEAMALRTMQTMNSALRNNFGLELLDTIEANVKSSETNLDDVIGDEIDTNDFLTEASSKNPATLTVFKNGEKVTFDIADEIYEALKPTKRYKFGILNKFSRLRRGLLTEYNPAFMLTNPIKDIQDGALNSKHPTLFLKKIPEAIAQITTKGDYYKLLIANGGSYETYFNYGESYNKMQSKRNFFDPRKILDKISNINQMIEMTPRLAEFMASLESGDNIETAMYNAQEITTNFKRGGNWTKNLDANGVTFLNASMQGAVKQIRNIQDAKVEGIRGMTNLAVKWAITGLTPYLLSQLVWGDDDDYEELSDYIKNNYYILWKNNDGTFIRIPKGRVTSVIQNLFSQPLDTLKGEKINVEEFLELLQNQVLPSDPTESNIFSPIFDVMTNTAWHGGDIVPERLQDLPAEEQYDEGTDSISKWLGNKLGISPIKINYILDQYSGAIGDLILPTLTLEAESNSNSFIGTLLSPLKDKFTANATLDNGNVSKLYDLSDELTKKSNSSKATIEDKLKNKYINNVKTEVSKLYKEKRNVQSDLNLTNVEKYNEAKRIQGEINKIARKGLSDYQDVNIYNNYGKVADKEYYLNSKNEWTIIDDEELKELSDLKMSDNDKNEYFSAKVSIGTIRSDKEKDSLVKHEEINDLLINTNLDDQKKAYLYGKYYSNEKILDTIIKSDIDFDEFLKYDSQEITSDYYANGKAVPNSRRNKVIRYINSLNLTIPQKAILIKLEYNSYDAYDRQIINYINNIGISKSEKEEVLEEMGFTIRNGKVYS